MKPNSPSVFSLVIVLLTIGGGIALTMQRRQSIDLRVALDKTKSEAAELAQLRDENRRLRERQVPAAELERLRSDHAALPRLRAELDKLQQPSSAAH